MRNCGELTLGGTSCSRRAREGREHCWQHPRLEKDEFQEKYRDPRRCGSPLKEGGYCLEPIVGAEKRCFKHAEEASDRLLRVRKQADDGSSAGRNDVGVMTLLGDGCPQNRVEAAKDIARAAEGGQPEGHTNLGLMHLFGKGVPKNMATAFRHLKEGAEGECRIAQFNLACFYDVFPEAIIRTFENPTAFINSLLEDNQGPEETRGRILAISSKDMALRWYRESAKRGDPNASYRLSVRLQEIGKVKEADHHRENAQRQFVEEGCRLSEGNGYVQDPSKAYTSYLMAAELGAETREERRSLENILSTNEIQNAGREADIRFSNLNG